MADGNVTAGQGLLGPAGPPPRQGGAAMAVAALVCGAVAVLLCWIPLVNLVSVLAGLVGVVLGVVALVLARRGARAGRRRAAVGVAAGALALVFSLVVDVIYVVQLGDPVAGTAAPPARPAPSVSAPSASASEGVPPSSPGPSGSTPAPPSAAQPLEGLPYGTGATVGDYTVTVTGVNTSANAAMAEANPFNEPPDGQYVLVDLSVVYDGADEGIPWAQLQATFQGTDARDYSSNLCSAVVPRPGFQQPNLRTGGAAEYQVCFDLPAEAVAGGAVEVAPLLSGQSATWAVAG